MLDAFSLGDDSMRRLLRNLDPMVSTWSSLSGSRFEFEGSTDDQIENLSVALDIMTTDCFLQRERLDNSTMTINCREGTQLTDKDWRIIQIVLSGSSRF